MKSNSWQLAVIVLVALVALYVALEIPHPDWVRNLAFWQPADRRDIALHLGLDLQGGLQVLLAADVPEDQELDAASMETARRVVENRVNGMGLTEPIVQAQGERRIIVELPGIEDPEQAVETVKSTALLEFADAGNTPPLIGTMVTTTLGGPSAAQPTAETPSLAPTAEAGLTSGSELTPTTELTPTAGITPTTEITPTTTPPTLPTPSDERVYETILTGAELNAKNIGVRVGQNDYVVAIEFQPDSAQVFADYTATHVGQYLCIVLDKVVISCPVIRSHIPDGRAQIQGSFTPESAQQLALQLRYGALPIPLHVESFTRIGATLGAESVEKSVRAGTIGLIVVLLFMLIYYRLPGGLADAALIIYVALNIALYKLAPITLTLPGIAGFILSAGMAVDANILIFERLKEELRHGRKLTTAIEIGFNRAWPSIRDAQLSTLIICAILFFFGTNFGASIVKGFAITLAVGTVVNVFTAVFATRTFVRQVAESAGEWLAEHTWLLGV